MELSLPALIKEVRKRAGDATPLLALEVAVDLSEELSHLSDDLINVFVVEGREAGHSWSEIGGLLGVSKQAAQQRFVTRPDSLGGKLFTHFSPSAREVVVAAQEEAASLKHNYLGTEHLLLALVRQEGPVQGLLASQDLSYDSIRESVVQAIGEGSVPPTGERPLTPRTKKVLELSLRESKRLGTRYVGTEHVLLGLLREGEGVAAQVLKNRGVSFDELRARVEQDYRQTG